MAQAAKTITIQLGERTPLVAADRQQEATALSGELPDWAESWSRARCECGAPCVNAACYCGGHLVCSVSGWGADECLSHAADSDALQSTSNRPHGPETDTSSSPV